MQDLEKRLLVAQTRLAEIAQAQEDTSNTPEPAPAEPPRRSRPDRDTSRVRNRAAAALVVSTRDADDADYLTLDYIQFLTRRSDDGAAEHETNHRRPTTTTSSTTTQTPRVPGRARHHVRVVANADGTVTPEGYEMDLDDWLAAITGPDADAYLATSTG